MFLLILILLSFLILLPFVNSFTKGDIGNPIYIIVLSSIFCILCSIYYCAQHDYNLSIYTFFIVVCGYSGIFAGFLLSKAVGNGKKIEIEDPFVFNMSLAKKISVLFVYIVITVAIINSVKEITGIVNGTISDYSSKFRLLTNSGTDDLPLILRQIYRANKIGCYYFVYIMVNQLIARKWQKSNWVLIGCIMLFAVQKVFMGSRSDLVYLLFAGISFFFVEYYRQRGRIKIPPKIFRRIILISTALFLLFAFTKRLFGRQTELPIFDYLMFYMGSSIFNLDYRMQHVYEPIRIIGYSFQGMNRSFSDYLHFGEKLASIPSTYINGIYNGNTYTLFYRYYCDWRFWGVFFLSMLFAFIMCRMYKRCIFGAWGRKRRLLIIFFGMFSEALYLVLYDEHFFSTRCNFGLITDILSCYFIDCFIVGIQLKRSNR